MVRRFESRQCRRFFSIPRLSRVILLLEGFPRRAPIPPSESPRVLRKRLGRREHRGFLPLFSIPVFFFSSQPLRLQAKSVIGSRKSFSLFRGFFLSFGRSKTQVWAVAVGPGASPYPLPYFLASHPSIPSHPFHWRLSVSPDHNPKTFDAFSFASAYPPPPSNFSPVRKKMLSTRFPSSFFFFSPHRICPPQHPHVFVLHPSQPLNTPFHSPPLPFWRKRSW